MREREAGGQEKNERTYREWERTFSNQLTSTAKLALVVSKWYKGFSSKLLLLLCLQYSSCSAADGVTALHNVSVETRNDRSCDRSPQYWGGQLLCFYGTPLGQDGTTVRWRTRSNIASAQETNKWLYTRVSARC